MTSTRWKKGDRFHNPYSFVPFGKRPTDGPLADAPPSGHARYTGEALSGTLEFTMEVCTPLLVPDRWDRDGEKHRTFGVLVDHDGAPIVHGASLKGALRSAYEIVTCSRVPFTDGWEKMFGKRLKDSMEGGGSPLDLSPKHVRPASRAEELSPADRLFGWVADQTVQARREGDDGGTAFRGALRIESIVGPGPSSVETLGEPLTLAILSTPKTAGKRFYYSVDGDGRPPEDGKREPKLSGLRGRKVYPPHSDGDPVARGSSKEKGNQNSTVTEWVRPGSKIRVRIRLDEVSEAELGGLLWVLRLCSEKGRLRMGFAKPLGFGSLRVEVGTLELRVQFGHELSKCYAAGRVPAPSSADAARIEEIMEIFRVQAGRIQGVRQEEEPWPPKAVHRAFEGFGDSRPFAYPIALKRDGNVDSGYAWFVKNERGERRSLPGIDADGDAQTLQVLGTEGRHRD
jgi:CRISPR/Cas system CSM-associated protein Csm3 (group 7 of RAMP superfamily)